VRKGVHDLSAHIYSFISYTIQSSFQIPENEKILKMF